MKFAQKIIFVTTLCVVVSGYSVTHWWFYPEGRVPSGMPGPGVDRTNIALRGWADAQLDANLPLHAFGQQSTGQSASNAARRLPVHLMFAVNEAYDALPAGSPIVGAELFLRVCAASSTKPTIAFSLYPVLEKWSQETATWESPWTNPGGDFGSEVDAVSCEAPDLWRYITVDVTEAVKYEYGHLGSTFGIALMDISDARPYVFTSETRAAEQRPYLHIMIPEPVGGCMGIVLIVATGSIFRRRSLRKIYT